MVLEFKSVPILRSRSYDYRGGLTTQGTHTVETTFNMTDVRDHVVDVSILDRLTSFPFLLVLALLFAPLFLVTSAIELRLLEKSHVLDYIPGDRQPFLLLFPAALAMWGAFGVTSQISKQLFMKPKACEDRKLSTDLKSRQSFRCVETKNWGLFLQKLQ